MRLLSFGDVTLPIGQGQASLQSSMRSNLVTLSNGAYDLDGGATFQQPFTIKYSCLISSSLQSTVDDIKAEASKGRQLLVALMRDTTKRQTWAKITNISHAADFNNYDYVQPLSITFQIDYPFWLSFDLPPSWGDGTLWGGGELWGGLFVSQNLTTTSATFAIDASEGTAPIRKGVITINPQSGGSFTDVRVDNTTNGFYFTYTGVGVADDLLVIDLLPQSIKLNGSNAYSGLFWPSDQLEIMRLEPENNSFTVAFTTIGGTVKFIYQYERHFT